MYSKVGSIETYYRYDGTSNHVLFEGNASGSVVAEYTYDAWGNILTKTDSIIPKENPYRYAGYRFDEETKLYYLMARYYNPDTAVFLSLDPVRGDIMNPITMNGYNYTKNNPVMNVDLDGEFSVKTNLLSNTINFLDLAIPFAGGMYGYLKSLSKVSKAYRISSGYKVVLKIQVTAAICLYIFGIKKDYIHCNCFLHQRKGQLKNMSYRDLK